MAQKRDYYEVLGVDSKASEKVIADAYRRLAIQYHPDKNRGDEEAVVKFKEAAEAFEVLSDPEKRVRYDRFGHAGVDGAGGGAHFTDVSEIFEAFGDIFGGGLFDGLFGRGSGRRRPQKGMDVRCDVSLVLDEAARGTTKTVEFDRHEPCDACEGSGAKKGTQPEACRYCGGQGQVLQSAGMFRLQRTCPSCHGVGTVIQDPCSKCSGEGFVLVRVQRKVVIPAGVDNHTKVRVAGEGEPSPNGGPRGDCYCFISVEEHPLFERQGQTLICHVPITYSQAALGATVEVPTLDGREEIKIPPGSQSGDVFKLPSRGMPDPRHRRVGDLVVVLGIEVPKKLTPRQDELLRDLAKEEQANVTPMRKNFVDKLKDYFVPHEDSPKSED